MISSPASWTKDILRSLGSMSGIDETNRWWARWISSARTLTRTSESEEVRSMRLKKDFDDCSMSRSSAVLVRLPLWMRYMPNGELTKNG